MKRKQVIAAVTVLLLLLLGLVLWLLVFRTPKATGSETAAVHPVERSEETEAAPEAYVSPVDFAALQKDAPDIYAWLSIEGSEVDLPVVQSADDNLYLRHDIYGNYSVSGAIFSESAYNDKSFDEQITVLYGHRMDSGEMFGSLQPMYSEADALDKYGEITVYLPESEKHYRVFAAVPYDNRHILYNYGDGSERALMSFLFSLTAERSLDALLNKEAYPESGDKLLVLSTCLYGDRTRRFIVVGKQTEEIS